MSAAGPIRHASVGPWDASPINPLQSDDQYTQLRARFNLIVSPLVSVAYPKNTPRWEVVTITARSFAFAISFLSVSLLVERKTNHFHPARPPPVIGHGLAGAGSHARLFHRT
jgi:hypothetical protein